MLIADPRHYTEVLSGVLDGERNIDVVARVRVGAEGSYLYSPGTCVA